MNCPLCIDQILDITYHGGIEIDVCPQSRGVWLDRGELEKLAGPERAAKSGQPVRQAISGDRPGPNAGKPEMSARSKKKRKKKPLGSRLGDVLEEVLDL